MTIPLCLVPDKRIPHSLYTGATDPDYGYFQACIKLGIIFSKYSQYDITEIALYINAELEKHMIDIMSVVRYCHDNDLLLTIYYEDSDGTWFSQQVF